MTAKVLRPAISISAVAAVLVAAVAVYSFLTVGTTHADSVYNPTTKILYCNGLPSTFPGPVDTDLAGPNVGGGCTETAANRDINATPNVTTILDEPTGNLNFSDVVAFAPTNAGGTPSLITPGCATATGCAAGTLPAGTKIGGLRSLTNLGLLNSSCNTALTVDFIFYSIAVPNGTPGPAGTYSHGTNIAFPRPEGAVNRFDGWMVGAEPPALGGTSPQGSGTATKAGADSIAVVNYPSYLLKLFSASQTSPYNDAVIPRALYGGISNVAGSWIPLYFAQFDSTQAAAIAALPEPLSLVTAAMGSMSQVILNDPTQSVASVSSITDFCTPLNSTSMLLGTSPGGTFIRAKNPAVAGTYFNLQYNASFRDTDQDGIENPFDTCPTLVNISGDPRVLANSGPNGNGIDGSCDTTGSSSDDVDGDVFKNRQDNCPLVSNPLQTESELHVSQADNGPMIDNIGNACDAGSTAGGIGTGADGCTGIAAAVQVKQNGQCISITLSNTVGNGRYIAKTNVVAKCIGASETDADLDGYCASSGDTDSGPHAAVLHPAWAAGSAPKSGDDSDKDTFTDAQETALSTCFVGGLYPCVGTSGVYDRTAITVTTSVTLGTDTTKSCAQTAAPGDEQPLDNWPMDFNDDQTSDLTDIFKIVPGLNLYVDQPPSSGGITTGRMDLSGDGAVDLTDIFKIVPALNTNCANGSAPGIPAWSQQ